MDRQRLYETTVRTIQAHDTGRAVPESLVTSIADMLLNCGDKNAYHGYERRSEAIVRHVNPRMIPGGEGHARRPDMVIFQREVFWDNELIHVFRVGDERKVLIVECKSDHDCNRRAMDQIRDYMDLCEFPAGLLLSQRRAFFFFQGNDDEEGIQPGPIFSDISQHVPEIADIIREL
ncbi:hypothetical protein IWQ61_010237 [Dispira simplex]|nr:hypothetical protein IWQ61_010237 [Dispira simplex]